MFLTTTNQTLELNISASGSPPSPSVAVVTGWVNHAAGGGTPNSFQSNITTDGDHTIVTAPAGAQQNQIRYISIKNTDTGPVTVTVQVDDTGVEYIISGPITLAANEILAYNDDKFIVFNALGEPQGSGGGSVVIGGGSPGIMQSEIDANTAAIATKLAGSPLPLYAELNDLTSAVTWANVPDANITESSVTQHEAALDITESQITDLQDYIVEPTSNGTAGQVLTVGSPVTNRIWSTVAAGSPVETVVVNDLSPQLGGNLDVNGQDITAVVNNDLRLVTLGSGSIHLNGSTNMGGDLNIGTNSIVTISNQDLNITPDGTGNIILDGQAFPNTNGTAGQVLTVGSPVTNMIWATIPTQPNGSPGVMQAEIDSKLAGSPLPLYTETNDLTAAVTWANVPDANITESSVTQHEAALDITESQITDLQDYIVEPTSNGTAGQVLTVGSPVTNRIWSTVAGGGGGSPVETVVVNDLSPQLGGNLDVNGQDITAVVNNDLRLVTTGSGAIFLNGSTNMGGDLNIGNYSIVTISNQDLNITPDGTGNIILDGQSFPQAPGTEGQVLTVGSPTTNLIWEDSGAAGKLDSQIVVEALGSPQTVTPDPTKRFVVSTPSLSLAAQATDSEVPMYLLQSTTFTAAGSPTPTLTVAGSPQTRGPGPHVALYDQSVNTWYI